MGHRRHHITREKPTDHTPGAREVSSQPASELPSLCCSPLRDERGCGDPLVSQPNTFLSLSYFDASHFPGDLLLILLTTQCPSADHRI